MNRARKISEGKRRARLIREHDAVHAGRLRIPACPSCHVSADDCLASERLEFVAHIAAPGYGQSWTCSVCDRPFVKIGDAFHDARDSGPFELSPEDVI
jgi:hypothetical protein